MNGPPGDGTLVMPADEPPSFGILLRRLRLAAHLTQEELAERAQLSRRAIQDLERGARRRPHHETVRLLADALTLDAQAREFLQAAAQRARTPDPGGVASVQARRALPMPLTSFVGREDQLQDIRELLGTTRLLTLVGAGGIGKTRLALRLANEILHDYADGVCLVELAPLAEPKLVVHAVRAALGLHEQPGQPPGQTLEDALQSRRLLLVLDNCEHLVATCAELAGQLLPVCPGLRLLATSREPLGIGGETVWRVPSLSVPEEHASAAPEQLVRSEAVRLFIERAQAALPGFVLTPGTTPAVGRICRRLDGIPLALELAAARVSVLSVEQIAERLDDALRLLVAGSRVALPRQQTLRATIEWSHDLLTATEQALLRRLAVFAGGWTLDAAEAVWADDAGLPGGALDLLAQLVDKSMVSAEPMGEPEVRYRFLETLRSYAREQLAASGEVAHIAQVHAGYFLRLAEQAAPELRRPAQVLWMDRLEREHDNLRAALRWAIAENQAEAGLRLGAALWRLWYVRGYLDEGLAWLDTLLRLPCAADALRGAVLNGAGNLAWARGEYGRAVTLQQEALALQRGLHDAAPVAATLYDLAKVLADQGDSIAARPLIEESLARWRELGDAWGVAAALNHLGEQARASGDYSAARRLYEDSLPLFEAAGDRRGVSIVTHNIAIIAAEEGDRPLAVSLHRACLPLKQELGDREGLVCSLINLAWLALLDGDGQRAARLGGAAAAHRAKIGAGLPPYERELEVRLRTDVQGLLGLTAFTAVWDHGYALSLEQAVAEALAAEMVPRSAPAQRSTAGRQTRNGMRRS